MSVDSGRNASVGAFGTHIYNGRAKGILKKGEPVKKVFHQGKPIVLADANQVLVENESGQREYVCPCNLRIIKPQQRMQRLM